MKIKQCMKKMIEFKMDWNPSLAAVGILMMSYSESSGEKWRLS